MDAEDGILVGFIALVIVIVLMCAAIGIGIMQKGNTAERLDLWAAECPFGHYWTEQDGNFLNYESYPNEAYALKFMDDGYLKTLVVPANVDWVKVILEDNLDDFYIYLSYEGRSLETDPEAGTQPGGDVFWIYIHVPDPKLFDTVSQ